MMADDVVGHSKRPTCLDSMIDWKRWTGRKESRLFECGYAILRDCGTGSDGTKHGRKQSGERVVEYPRDTFDGVEHQRRF